jgi:hypothetical protein
MIVGMTATNCMCFTTFEVKFPPGGALIEGGNAKGKTSILKIIRAALTAYGVGPDMVKKGATSSQIVVALDTHTITRVMTLGDKFKTSVKVLDGNGKTVPDGQAFLRALLGLSPLDPIELFLEPDKRKRRAKILSAIPCLVTAEQLKEFCPPGADLLSVVGSDGRGGLALADHGLEVVERARKVVYVWRTDANRAVKDRQAAMDLVCEKERIAYDALQARRLAQGLPEIPVTVSQAEALLDEAKTAQLALTEQARSAEAAVRQQAKTRTRIAELRAQASAKRQAAPLAPTEKAILDAAMDIDVNENAVVAQEAVVRDLMQQLTAAQSELAAREGGLIAARTRLKTLEDQQQLAEAAVDEIADLEGRALEQEEALGTAPVSPTEEQFATAKATIAQATQLVEYARDWIGMKAIAADVDTARVALTAAQVEAGALDASVKRLTDEAPAALLAAADSIQGLTIDGEDVYLDGVALDQLSGMERMFFATDVAKRLNAKSLLLCVDGLEALDAEHREAFIKRATEGGYQLIATRVSDDGGEPTALPIASQKEG